MEWLKRRPLLLLLLGVGLVGVVVGFLGPQLSYRVLGALPGAAAATGAALAARKGYKHLKHQSDAVALEDARLTHEANEAARAAETGAEAPSSGPDAAAPGDPWRNFPDL